MLKVYIDPGPEKSGVVWIHDPTDEDPAADWQLGCGMLTFKEVERLITGANLVCIEHVTGYGGVIVSNEIRDQLLDMGAWRQIAAICGVEMRWLAYPEIMRRLFGTQRVKTGRIVKDKKGRDREETRAWKETEIRTRLLELWGGRGDPMREGANSAYGGLKCPACKGKGWRGRGRPTCESCGGGGYAVRPGPLHPIPWNAQAHEWSALAVGWAAEHP